MYREVRISLRTRCLTSLNTIAIEGRWYRQLYLPVLTE
ncbi:hypothetical protein NXF25_019019 [Crotalus adamanteus]|uniref:Uncharacterized protein n=1 Tax=Crotalus adamanteus TaxID=8729 RepID=A0AAW1B1F2_CROAD